MHAVKDTKGSSEAERIFPDELQDFMKENPEGSYTLLDVRQPFEYEEAHLPGAKLIPLPRLADSFHELDPEKRTFVYCRMGGRSRMAAQLLSHHGFASVRSLEGGLDGWEGRTAASPAEFHLEFLRGDEGPDEAIRLAFRMEEGLRRFHESMGKRTEDPELRKLLGVLVKAEESHERALLSLLSSDDARAEMVREISREDAPVVMEGGIDPTGFVESNEAYLRSASGYIELAMMIETQALDLYLRMANQSANEDSRKALLRIGDEEKAHMTLLAALLEEKAKR